MPKLSNDINLKFVQYYREKECLWNALIPAYKNKSMRDSSLHKMSDELSEIGIIMTISEIKNKIKNLRSTYSQTLAKIEQSTRSGAGANDEYKPKMSWFDEMHGFIKHVAIKRKTTDSQEVETIDEVPENSEAGNSKDNIGSNEDNIDKRERISNLVAQPSTSSSSYKRPSTSTTSVPNPKRRRIAQVTSLVDEIRSIKEDLKNIPETNISDENEHDIFGKFVASQLKKLSTTQAILARDQIHATLSRCRLHDLNYGNTTFLFPTPSHHSSDSNMTRISTPTPQTSEGSILSATECENNCDQHHQSNKIHYGDSDNISESILLTFNNV